MMDTHLEILTQTIPRLFELCDTIREAAAHGDQEPGSLPAMKEDITAGIRAVEAAVEQLCPVEPPTPVELESLAAMDGGQLARFAEDWFAQSMAPCLVVRFVQTLQEVRQFS